MGAPPTGFLVGAPPSGPMMQSFPGPDPYHQQQQQQMMMMMNMNHMNSETNSLLGTAAPLSHSIRSSQRKRKPGPGSHRRSLSSGSGYGGRMYGGGVGNSHSFDGMPPPGPPRQQQEKFSPRGEFMKLTSSFRNKTPPSPSGRKTNNNISPRNGYSISPQETPRHSRNNSFNGRVSFSPHNNSHYPPPSPRLVGACVVYVMILLDANIGHPPNSFGP